MNRSTVEIDMLAIHADDLGDVVGDLHGTPIRSWYPRSSVIRNLFYARQIVYNNKQVRAK